MVISGNHTDWQYIDLVDGNEHITINPTSPNNNMRFATRGPLPAGIGEFMFNSIGGTYISDAQTLDYWSVNINEIRDYRNSDWYSGINWNTCLDKVLLDNPTWTARSEFEYLNNLVGKKIQFQDGIYTITLTGNNDTYQDNWSYWASGQLYNYLYGILNTALPSGILGVNRYPVAYRLFIKKFRFTLTQVNNVKGTYKYSLPQTVRKLDDAPYKMFCIPYYTGNYKYRFSVDGTSYVDVDEDIQMA